MAFQILSAIWMTKPIKSSTHPRRFNDWFSDDLHPRRSNCSAPSPAARRLGIASGAPLADVSPNTIPEFLTGPEPLVGTRNEIRFTSGEQAFGRPVFRRVRHPFGAILWRVQLAEIGQPENFGVASSLDNPRIPDPMHVRAAIEPANLGLVPTFVVIVAHVAGLVQVLDAVEQEPQREPTLLDRLALIFHDEPKLVDLVHHATLRGNVATELGVVLGLIQRNIDVMPRGRVAHLTANLVCPERCVRQRLVRL